MKKPRILKNIEQHYSVITPKMELPEFFVGKNYRVPKKIRHVNQLMGVKVIGERGQVVTFNGYASELHFKIVEKISSFKSKK